MRFETEKHVFEVHTSQPLEPALSMDSQRSQYAESFITDLGSSFTSCHFSRHFQEWIVRREAFCDNFITLFEEDETPVSYLISSDEATCHMHGSVIKQTELICGRENPDASVEFMLVLYGPFFLIEYTVIGTMCLDILELWLCRQLKEEFPGYSFFHQDGDHLIIICMLFLHPSTRTMPLFQRIY
jgi:hypothetical protein